MLLAQNSTVLELNGSQGVFPVQSVKLMIYRYSSFSLTNMLGKNAECLIAILSLAQPLLT